ncbi:MAG: threonine ammonia-lyase, biosynthetic [Ilumatobacter sp.]|uniref:threonine ammonia-lyase, biosynthetic n=1 Tax=Ilumatobacter sp. TaxID=1967498 RepID=UPI003C713D44
MSDPHIDDVDYLRRILNARVYDVAIETPLEPASDLSRRLGNTVLLKREDLQEVFSFKLRGAYNKMANLPAEELAKGVIASSAGNHAQGVALAANELGCRAVIVMPTTAPSLKVEAVAARGAEIVLHGESYNEAFEYAQQLMRELGLTFVHPFDDPDVIAGQGTIGMEILRQHGRPIHAIFAAIGGGGLISGIATYVKQVRPDIKIIGVQHVESDAMRRSVAAGERVELADVGLFSDGTAVKQVGVETLRLVERYVDDILVVDTDETCAAIKDAFTATRTLLEPAGALAIAGLKQYAETSGVAGETLVAVSCGANMNFDRLRFVSERAEIGERREAVFAVTIPEQPGSFRRFCEVVGGRDVTEFNYRISDATDAHVFVGVSIRSRAEADELADSFREAGFETLDLTDDELAKVHLRHLVGGKSQHALDEVLHRFEFPERPGALMNFLRSMQPHWNISLFHYRNHGSDSGRVLVGMQVPESDLAAFDDFLDELGYRHWNETLNPAYRLFL